MIHGPSNVKLNFVLRLLVNPLNAELNPIRHLLALVGARHIVHVSRIRVNLPAFGLLVALKPQTPGDYRKEGIRHSRHGERVKSRLNLNFINRFFGKYSNVNVMRICPM